MKKYFNPTHSRLVVEFKNEGGYFLPTGTSIFSDDVPSRVDPGIVVTTVVEDAPAPLKNTRKKQQEIDT